MKVSEAEKKVCPFIQDKRSFFQKFLEDLFAFSTESEPANISCICGDCMAWEYTKTHEAQYEEIEGTEEYIRHIQFKILEDKELPENEKEGYCKRLEND